MLLLQLGLCLSLWFNSGLALRNVTVDDRNPLINYTPASEWIKIQDTLDAGGGHMLTNFHASEATIIFSFVNMYYMSTRWHYHVGAVIVVDGVEGVADMQDYNGGPDPDDKRAVVASSVVWSFKGDGMKERKVVVKVPPEDTLTVVDMFIFEVDDNATTSLSTSGTIDPTSGLPTITSNSLTNAPPNSLPTSSPAPSSSPSAPSTTAHSSGLNKQTKALVIALSIVGAAFLALFLFFIRRMYTRKSVQKEDEAEKAVSFNHKEPQSNIADADGKPTNSPRASMGQASNSPSNDDDIAEVEIPVQSQPQNIQVPTSLAMIPPPERRPTVIARPVQSDLRRNPTTVSIQHGLDLPTSRPRPSSPSTSPLEEESLDHDF